MGKKIPIVSFLCGVLTGRKKAASPPRTGDEADKREDIDSSTSGGGGNSPEPGDGGGSTPEEQQPLPPPPGGVGRHMRTVSCQHNRTHSGMSKLVSSMSLKIMGGEEKVKQKLEKKFHKHEDSVWKKTIILGEKCRVPDEEEDDILYDEKGRKISTYHPKTHSGVLSMSKQTSSFDEADFAKK